MNYLDCQKSLCIDIFGKLLWLFSKQVRYSLQFDFYISIDIHLGFILGNASQKLWSDPNLTEERKNQEFAAINSELDIYFQELAGAFVDPRWRQGIRRKPFVVCLDSTKVYCQKPSDATAQKELFSSDKQVCIYHISKHIHFFLL